MCVLHHCARGAGSGFTYGLLLLLGGGALSAGLLLALALLEEGLRDEDLVVGGNGTVDG